MSKFGDAFKRGQVACESAERAQEEIRGVFHVLSKDIEEQTGGRVSMSVLPPAELEKLGAGGAGHGRGATLLAESKDDALVATVSAGESVQLCTVKVAPSGYPVVLAFPGHAMTAFTRTALENALGSLLAYPDVASKLKLALAAAERAPSATSSPAAQA